MDDAVATVRLYDKDRYLATLFAPDELQPHLFALYAFKCEIERIPFLVTEPQMGEIRLRWWIDTVEQFGDDTMPDHPLAAALVMTVRQYKLPLAGLTRLIEARQFDLYADNMPARNDLEGYLGETESIVFQLAATIVDPAAARSTTNASGFAGVALGLARILNRPNHEKFLPPDETDESLRDLARSRLAEFRREKLPRNLLPVFLPAALTETYLAAGPKPVPQWKRQWRLWRAARTETV